MPTQKKTSRQQRARRILLQRRENWTYVGGGVKMDGYDLLPGQTTAQKIDACDAELANLSAKGVK